MGTACAGVARRAKCFAAPGTLADAASGYGLLAHDRPPRRGWASPDFPSGLILRGDGHRAPAVRRRAGTTARDGQENDAGPASRFIAAPWGWRMRRGGPQRVERWRPRRSPAAPAAEPVAVPP